MCNPEARRLRAAARASKSAVLVTLLLAGLASQPLPAAQSLDAWLHDDLLPYLSVRLVQHPRLKGQPFEVVVMKDNQIVSDMDGLSAYVRQRIVDTMQAVPDANLIQPLPTKSWAYRSIGEINCSVAGQANVQVTIETGQSGVMDEVRLTVQALDLVEHAWVRGFKKVWTGIPTEMERKRLAARHADNSRFGSRGVPFGEDQPDLLASYLASSVACRFKEAGEGRVRVFARPPQEGAGDYLRKVSALISEYLSGLREIEFPENRGQTDASLGLEAHQIDGNLYQVWAQIGGRAEDRVLVRSSASAYVILSEGVPLVPLPADRADRLVGQFDLIGPAAGATCRDAATWTQGYRVLGSGTHLPSGGCFALRYQAVGKATLYLITQDSKGRTTQLLPSSCDALNLGTDGEQVVPARVLHIPLFRDGKPGYFLLDNQPGSEAVFAVAVADADTENKLRHLVESAGSLCRTENPSRRRPIADLQEFLDALMREQGRNRLDWRAVYFIHDAASQ